MRSLILVAGGTGTRMNRPVAKQFLPLGDRPVIVHTLARFREAHPDLFVVLVYLFVLAEQHGYLDEEQGAGTRPRGPGPGPRARRGEWLHGFTILPILRMLQLLVVVRLDTELSSLTTSIWNNSI